MATAEEPPRRRRKPSDKITTTTEVADGPTLVAENDLGRVIELVPPTPEPTRAEMVLDRVRRGDAVLDKPRTKWLVKGWLPEASAGIGYGPPGGGKSFYALTLALEAARGGRWAGHEVEPMRVLYIAAERAAVLGDRQEAWRIHRHEAIPSNFHELVWAPQLHKEDDLATLVEVVRTLKVRLVIIDTLAQCTLGLEENSSKEMGVVIDALHRLTEATEAGSVFVVHHTGKDASRGMRGSSALLGSVDYTIEIGGDATAIRARVEKLNAAVHPLPEWYKLEPLSMPALPEETEQRSGAVLVPTTGKDAGGSRVAELVAKVAELPADAGIGRVDVEELLGIGRTLAYKVIKAAEDAGYLVVTGKGPQARYYMTDEARALLDK